VKGRLFAAAVWLAAAWAAAAPTATPTPAAPRLSGGFGKPKNTPSASAAQGGQSLQDVVRAASQTRESREIPKPAVAITNETLVTDPKRGRLTTWQGVPAVPTSAPAATPGAPAATSAPAPAATPVSEEQVWRERARNARQRVDESKERAARLEAESKKLENDFYAWDDGQYRDNVIKPAWDKKREELETARRDLDAAERDLADLPEQARKAGALPGWIRE
jgi:hypothetical protein